ncbi:MAG: hypothetical protein HXY23_00505 [Parvularculaceae bacterium]|nr:hypothetical protein [Parvularculaceae bacterium]
MNRLMIASAMLVFAASAAQAAPRFGSLSASDTASSESRAETSPFLAWSERFIIARLKGDATAPVAKQKQQELTKSQPECDEAKKAEEQKRAEAAPGLAGPEPLYLAF